MSPNSHHGSRGSKALSILALLLAPALLVGCERSDPEEGSEAGLEVVEATDLEARIRARLDALDAHSSLYAKHLPTGRTIAIRADAPMNTLSVIKIPIMVLAFRDSEAGRLDLDARYRIEREDLRRGSGILKEFQVGIEPTYRDLVTQMIITSDNSATDIMIRTLGLERVNGMLEEQGYRETVLKHTTGRLFKETWVRTDPANAALTDVEVYERGFPSDEGAAERFFQIEGDSTIWLGRTTAREMSRLLEQIIDAELTSPESVEEMLDILDDQMYNSRLPQRIQRRARIAHKTGDWPPYAGNDVGILFYEGGPAIVSAFTNQSRGDFFELEATLGLIAEDLVNAWN